MAACTGPFSAPSASPTSSAEAAACTALIDQLPPRVDGAGRTAYTPYAVGWGSPRIDLRCGIPLPLAYAPTSELVVVEGVSWLPEQTDEVTVFTTVGRTPMVDVRVPAEYYPPTSPLVDVADAVKATTDITGVAGQ